MAVALLDFVGSLKREVQPPGTDLFPGVTDAEWVQYLADAFWEARLDGFLTGYVTEEGATAQDTTIVGASGGSDPDRRAIALIVLYAGIRVLRNRILNTQTQFRAKAGPVEFEQQNSATMLAEMLKQLRATKERILDELAGTATDVLVIDAFSTRVFSPLSYHGGLELTEGV